MRRGRARGRPMTDASTSVPGSRLIAAMLALGLLSAAWLRTGRVAVPQEGREAGAAPVAWPDMRLDLNSASVAELVVLPGLGERLAERIVADREARGPFRAVEDLARVEGVSAALAERVSP